MKSEAPMRVEDYRAKHGLSRTSMCAIRRAMQLAPRSRFIIESEVNKWRREHLDFRQTDVYPKKVN